MKIFAISAFLICIIGIRDVKSQTGLPEKEIGQADSLWKTNKLSKAIEYYEKLLSRGDIPGEYLSLVYLRLAEALYQYGLYDKCIKTISGIKSLPFLPDHHKLITEELLQKIKRIPAADHTIIYNSTKIAARVFVSEAQKKYDPENETCKTIEEALVAVQMLLQKRDLPEGSVEVILEGSSYNINKTIKAGAQFSGTRRNPVVIRSFSPEKIIMVSGGIKLKYWQKETDPEIILQLPETSRGNVIVADLKKNGISGIDSLVFGGFSSKRASRALNSRFSSFPVPELFYNGKPQMIARWPNNGDTLVSLTDFKNSRVLSWAAEKDLWLHGYWQHMWADAYEKVKSISIKDTVIILQPPLNSYGFGKSKWHVVNALSEMDVPGEWCLSANEGKVWYLPPSGFDPDKCIISVNGPAFIIENCDYLTVRDIDIRYIRGDGMVFLNCNNLTLLNCSVRDASGYGIKILGGKNHLIHSCLVESMGRGGIDIISGKIRNLENSGSIIENCTIRNLSRIDRTYTPAILLEGVGIKVRHCLFSEIPSSAIRLEGNDMLIELNEFSRCVIESDDQGAIDVFGNPLYRGNIIRWNFFHETGIPGLHMAAGVRLDDAISGFSVYENLFLRSSSGIFGGIQIHGGKDNYIEGNIFSDCKAGISQSAWGDKRWEATLKEKGHPVYTALNTLDWKSDLWQKHYPSLKNLTEGGTDTNYSADNLVINGQTIFLRKSPKFQTLNNIIITGKEILNKPADYIKYVSPWQEMPLQRIGTY